MRLSSSALARARDQLRLAHRRFEVEAQPIIEKMRRYLLGEQWRPLGTGTDATIARMVVNLLFADVKVMLPTLALRNPRIFIKPVGATAQMPIRGPGGVPDTVPVQLVNGRPVRLLEAAKAQEALVNWRWRQLRGTQTIRRVLVDAMTAPFGVVKLGYTLRTEKVEAPAATAEGLAEGPPEQLEVNELIKADSPFAVRWSPLDFRVDPEARYPDLSDAAWVAFGWRARAEDLQRNPRFHNTKGLTATVEIRESMTTGVTGPGAQGTLGTLRPGDFEGERMRVQCWEIWDKRAQTRLVLADEHDRNLEYVDWPAAYENFPAETLYFLEYPDALYGPPDLAHVLGQQDQYNELATMIRNHVKRFLRKYLVTRGALDEKEMRKLEEPVDGQIIESDAAEPAKAIVPVPDAAIPMDWWQAKLNVRDDHDRVSGIGDFIRGVAEKVDTATEASFIQSNLNVRTNDQRDLVEDLAERMARGLLRIDAQTIDLPASVPILGPDGALAYGQFIQITDREHLLAKSDIEVEVGSMQPINQIRRKRDMLEVYTLLKNDPLVDQFELRRRLIPAYADSIPDLDKLFLSRPQAEAVVQAMAREGAAPPTALRAQPGPRPAAAGIRRPTAPAALVTRPVRPPDLPEGA